VAIDEIGIVLLTDCPYASYFDAPETTKETEHTATRDMVCADARVTPRGVDVANVDVCPSVT